ncbi:MAG: Ribulose-phosphate 3-epimerase [Parcubacteria group bacterium GW2011_GWC1_45_13]|nr:MAG: Ribulose-phosphate 3-epimerase [Parcubacteria group bacterium GW2011_GWC1_45_13]
MVEIIPSINVSDFDELKKRIKKVEPYFKWAHLDVSDGVFTKHVSWHDPKDLVGLKTKLKLEVHLMIDRPERTIEEWLIKPVSRVIFHQEATKDHRLLIDKIQGHVRHVCPECIIEVDGGVNKRVAARCIKEGANLLVAGKAIFDPPTGGKNIKKVIAELKNAAS